MRLCIVAALALGSAAAGQEQRRYQIDQKSVAAYCYRREGDRKFVYRVTFRFLKGDREADPAGSGGDQVVIRENGREVHRFDLEAGGPRALTAVLAMDVSGSMERQSSETRRTKMKEAQDAAHVFFDKLHPRADAGLILFDHLVKEVRPPAGRPEGSAEHRRDLLALVDAARPGGGTAYYDAAYDALFLLQPFRDTRVVVVMTDGVDLNSKRDKKEVIYYARKLGIPIFTLGVGDPGWEEPVTTVLVLDQSLSMEAPANDVDKKTKMEALHEAASRFVELMRHKAQATVLPFSSRVEGAGPITGKKDELKERIRRLRPTGGTSLYDATYQGIETAVATRPPGKRFVVALTDGVDEDPGSRHDPDEIIAHARAEKVPLFMLGLGKKQEINEAVMRRMAEQTGGKYYHASDQAKLLEIFEKLSLDIHGDAIDEVALRELAEQTGGKYYPARDAAQLKVAYEQVTEDLKDTYTVVFPSLNQQSDGTVSGLDIVVVDRAGKVVSTAVDEQGRERESASADVARHGLVVPESDYGVYLALLAVLAVLLYLPSALRGGAAT